MQRNASLLSVPKLLHYELTVVEVVRVDGGCVKCRTPETWVHIRGSVCAWVQVIKALQFGTRPLIFTKC